MRTAKFNCSFKYYIFITIAFQVVLSCQNTSQIEISDSYRNQLEVQESDVLLTIEYKNFYEPDSSYYDTIFLNDCGCLLGDSINEFNASFQGPMVFSAVRLLFNQDGDNKLELISKGDAGGHFNLIEADWFEIKCDTTAQVIQGNIQAEFHYQEHIVYRASGAFK